MYSCHRLIEEVMVTLGLVHLYIEFLGLAVSYTRFRVQICSDPFYSISFNIRSVIKILNPVLLRIRNIFLRQK
jgi:hypothetical protein